MSCGFTGTDLLSADYFWTNIGYVILSCFFWKIGEAKFFFLFWHLELLWYPILVVCVLFVCAKSPLMATEQMKQEMSHFCKFMAHDVSWQHAVDMCRGQDCSCCRSLVTFALGTKKMNEAGSLMWWPEYWVVLERQSCVGHRRIIRQDSRGHCSLCVPWTGNSIEG